MTVRIDSARVNLAPVTADATERGDAAPPAAADVLPEVDDLMFSGDPGAMLAALTMTVAHDEAKTARQQRDAALSAQEKSEAAEIQDLHDKANLQRIQGAVDGLCDFAQAGTDVAQGVNTYDATIDGLHADALKDGVKHADDHHLDVPSEARDSNTEAATMLQQQSARESAAANAWKSGGEFLGGAKQIADGVFQGAITDKDADEKAHAASADAFKRIADDAHDGENDAKQLMTKALDFYKEYVDTKNQTVMAALRRA